MLLGDIKSLSIIVAGELQESSTIWDVVKGFKDKGIRRVITINTLYLNKISNIDQKIAQKFN